MSPPVFVRGAMRVAGSGLAVPGVAVSNDDVVAVMAPFARNARAVTAMGRMLAEGGLRERYWAKTTGEDTVDLAERAARAALADAGVALADVDLVVLALSTSTLPTIATSTPLVARLGFRGPSLDLKAGCAGSLYALQLAAALLAAGYRRILLVGADAMASYVDPQALMGFPNVGDGAGALVVEAAPHANFNATLDGEYATWDVAGVMGPLPPVHDDPTAYVFRGQATALREPIALRYREGLTTLLGHLGLPFADLDAWIPHQISPPLLKEVYASFGAPGVELFLNAERYGNTGSASLYMALHEAKVRLGGARVGLSALGGGMRWGTAVWENWA